MHQATNRKEADIKLCLATNKSVLTALQMMERFPREIGKKVDQLKRSVEKIERLLYEISLSKRGHVQITSTDMETETNEN